MAPGWCSEGLQHARLRWGKLKDDFIVNDTQAVADYLHDAWPDLMRQTSRRPGTQR